MQSAVMSSCGPMPPVVTHRCSGRGRFNRRHDLRLLSAIRAADWIPMLLQCSAIADVLVLGAGQDLVADHQHGGSDVGAYGLGHVCHSKVALS
jgi:hypothetical protein